MEFNYKEFNILEKRIFRQNKNNTLYQYYLSSMTCNIALQLSSYDRNSPYIPMILQGLFRLNKFVYFHDSSLSLFLD